MMYTLILHPIYLQKGPLTGTGYSPPAQGAIVLKSSCIWSITCFSPNRAAFILVILQVVIITDLGQGQKSA